MYYTNIYLSIVYIELLREMCDMYDRRLILYKPLVTSLLKEVETSSDVIEGLYI